MKNIFFYQTKIGKIAIAEENQHITNLFFENSTISNDFVEKETPLIKQAYIQLEEYFAKKRKAFDLPFCLQGTEFQKNVWSALSQIPYGKTVSYKDIALQIKCPSGYRAVGNANNKNPIPIFIPCHRVIASNGELAGYAGGVMIKKILLELEGII